ncbi:hypothetical protein LLG95_02185 [bacterium]|nr:hypothetical protein [bacterium]
MKKQLLLIAAVVLTTSLAPAATITARQPGDIEIAAIPNEGAGEQTPKQAILTASEKPTTATTAAKAVKPKAEADGEQGLTFNFHNAPLDTVLDYMSRAGGFVIVKMVNTEGKVNVTSHQPLNRSEAVDLLNTVLNENGYAAVRNGRILKIVSREDAKTYDLEVIKKDNIDPKDMPSGDEMVHEIIPVRYADATAMLNDIQPLLPSWSTVTANTASNSIVITDTRSNIKRIAQIIKALDTSISEITTIEVYILQYADAQQVTDMVNQLFAQSGTGANNRNNRGAQMAQFFARMRGGRGQFGGPGGMGGGMGMDNTQPDSQARQAASRVLAVADTRTNAVVVSAPDELHPTIAKIIEQVDNTKELETQIRVFPLQYADATEMTDVITKMYTDSSTAASTMNNRNNQQRGGRGAMTGGRGGFQAMAAATSANGQSARQIQEHTVTAVADTRTNSVIVIAVESVLDQVQKVIENLDQDSAGHQKVFVYQIHNIDPEQAALMLQDMFENSGTGSSSTYRSSTNRNSSSYNSSSTNRNSSSSNRNSSSNYGSSSRSSSSSSFGGSSRSSSSRSY